jgi:hypothetical protein
VVSACARVNSNQTANRSTDAATAVQVVGPDRSSNDAASPSAALDEAQPAVPLEHREAVQPPDAGTSCRVLGGPVALSPRGATAIVARGEEMLFVFNENGHPAVTTFRVGPLRAGALTPISSASPTTPSFRVPCAVAGDIAFCPDRDGSVNRSTLGGTESRWVASSFPGTRVSAARLAGSAAALVYLARRQTSEGLVSEAWIVADDGHPERISEDGSGATSSALAARGAALVALTVDARVALTAMHAREIRYDRGLQLGEDVVTFVGGPGDTATGAALAIFPQSESWALFPTGLDISSFGMAIVKVDAPPRVDEPVHWSMYPDGLDPAPVATITVGDRVWVALLRPVRRGSGVPRDLELGELLRDGTFIERHVIPDLAQSTDLALAADRLGALWLTWFGASGTWLERLSCH